MNRTIAHDLVFDGWIADLGHAYFFKSAGINTKYPKGTYIVRYADREETFTCFRKAYSCAYQNNTNEYF